MKRMPYGLLGRVFHIKDTLSLVLKMCCVYCWHTGDLPHGGRGNPPNSFLRGVQVACEGPKRDLWAGPGFKHGLVSSLFFRKQVIPQFGGVNR